MKTTSFLVAVSSLLPVVFAQDKPPSSHGEKFSGLNVLDSGTNGGLNGKLGPVNHSIRKWGWGTLPEQCFNSANNGYCNPYDVEVYEVTYSDCGSPVVICRCNWAQLSIGEAASMYGRLPVHARQHNRYLNVHPSDGGGCHAHSTFLDITVFGRCEGATSVYLHALSHNLDYQVAGINGHAYSNLPEWKQTIASDSCLADSYAKSSYTEAYAQVGVITACHQHVQSIWNLGVGYMANQINRVWPQLQAKFLHGQTCEWNWGYE